MKKTLPHQTELLKKSVKKKKIKKEITPLMPVSDEAMYQSVIDELPCALFIEVDQTIVFANQAAAELLEAPKAEALIGKSYKDFLSSKSRSSKEKKQFLIENKTQKNLSEEQWITMSGKTIDVDVNQRPTIFNGQAATQWLLQETSQRNLREKQLRYLIQHDELTGLANRVLLKESLEKSIRSAERYTHRVAVLFIDLDGFKAVNDTLGHDAGDALLKSVAKRLRRVVRAQDTIARLGGDEFVVVFTQVQQLEHVNAIAKKILACLMEPFNIHGHKSFVTASIGISIYPEDGKNTHDLLKSADVAMYRAKEQGRNNYQFCTAEMTLRAQARALLENDLRRALAEKQFRLYYQPSVDSTSNKIVSVEALLRWQHPHKGLLAAEEFIAVAEDSGLIVPIGEWALRTACAQQAQWFVQGLPPIAVSVNISARQLKQSDLVKNIATVLRESSIDPQYLILELTEEALMQDINNNMITTRALQAMGVHIALDNFGSGDSLLNYLKRFGVEKLKVDHALIRDVLVDPNAAAAALAIVAIARSFKINVTAEGVEQLQQKEFLSSESNMVMQGFLFGEAQPEEKITELLKEQMQWLRRKHH